MKNAARRLVRRIATSGLQAVGAPLRAEIIEALSETAVCETPIGEGTRLRFFAPTPLLRSRATAALTKEPDMVRWIDGFAPDAVFWDIGANVGVFSLYAAVKTRCRVLAFEPSAANFSALTRNVLLNDAADRLTAYCLAFSPQTRLGALNLSSCGMGAGLSHFGDAGDASPYMRGPGAGAHGMLGFAIDEFIDTFEPPFPTYVKIDVDGLEIGILSGAERMLHDPRLRAAMIELSLTDAEQRARGLALIEAAGLRLEATGAAQHVGAAAAANHLFLRHG